MSKTSDSFTRRMPLNFKGMIYDEAQGLLIGGKSKPVVRQQGITPFFGEMIVDSLPLADTGIATVARLVAGRP